MLILTTCILLYFSQKPTTTLGLYKVFVNIFVSRVQMNFNRKLSLSNIDFYKVKFNFLMLYNFIISTSWVVNYFEDMTQETLLTLLLVLCSAKLNLATPTICVHMHDKYLDYYWFLNLNIVIRESFCSLKLVFHFIKKLFNQLIQHCRLSYYLKPEFISKFLLL